MPSLRSSLLVALLPLAATALLLALATPPRTHPAGVKAAAAVEPGEAYAWLGRLQADHGSRAAGSKSLQTGVAFIASSLHAAGARRVHVQRLFYEGEPVLNVIGTIRGRSRDRIVIAAHHDVVPGAPGAIDDGGAIAALLAATRAIARGPTPPCDVEIAIFDGEERGCLGSKARLARRKRGLIRVALAVELVGWRHDRLVAHTIPYGFAWEAEGIAPAWVPVGLSRAGRAANARVGFGDPTFAPWYQATTRILKLRTGSDAGAYSEAGIPSVMLTGSSLTNFYSAYHRPTDTMEQVDPDRLDDAARVIAASVWEFGALRNPSATLGVPSLSFGERTLGPLALGLIGLLAALAAAWAALQSTSERGERGHVLLALSLVAFSLQGSVIGLLCFVPLASALALASSLRQSRAKKILVLILGTQPLVVELLLILGASLSFGFGWRAGPLETFGLLLASAGTLLAFASLGAKDLKD
ncbi:MAG: M20/M25/M40 family metallo-hydrolase [Planctomycetes bacterium]|nr:M20/M25/M40 family metallo-hydrolase [Planctomycetota bacterium]